MILVSTCVIKWKASIVLIHVRVYAYARARVCVFQVERNVEGILMYEFSYENKERI